MRIINIDLSQDFRCPQKVFGGNAREHNESKLIVKLPDRMIQNDISYYFFEFQTVLGEYIVSPNIYKASLIDKNKISVTLWEQLIPAAGDLLFCVDAVNLGKDNSITIKGKTSFCALQILKSPTGDSTLIDISSTKEELQEVIDKALQDAKDSGDFKGEQGDVGVDQMNTAISEALSKERLITNTACANALRGSASGAAVRLPDVSPNEHTLGVKVSSKNLIPHPYPVQGSTINGITYTNNADGSVTAVGTATDNSIYTPYTASANFELEPGTYTFSDDLVGTSNITYWSEVRGYKDDTIFVHSYDTNRTFTITEKTKLRMNLRVLKEQTVNITFKPQIVKGTADTSFSPYVSDLTTVNVTRCGKNLIPYPYPVQGSTINGITYTNNADGSVTAVGTATDNSIYTPYTASANFELEPGTYTFSDDLVGTSNITYWSEVRGYKDDTIFVHSYDTNRTFTITEKTKLRMNLRVLKEQTVNITFKPQIELGTTATEYELYKTPTEYTPAADGTVSGVKSLYPTTTLMTDTEGVIIDAEYNRDINKAFAELQQTIISLGGNV